MGDHVHARGPWLRLLFTLVVFGSVACAPAAAPGPGAASPQAPSAQPAPRPDATADWDGIVAAARREGKLVILGPPGADVRDSFVQGFQQRFPEVQIDYRTGRGADHLPKLALEREAGQYLADVYIGGTNIVLDGLLPANSVEPIRPYLIGPEVLDGSKWLGGAFDFADEAGLYALSFGSNVKAPLAYHPASVSPGDIRSWWDLLDPRWRGKLAMPDPRTVGAARVTTVFFYTTPDLGKDYLRQLFTSGIVLSKEARQVLDWVGRGQYPIAVAASELESAELKRKGVPIDLLPAEAFREGSYLTSGLGNVAVIERAPHPNATKVYLNWLLSRDGQYEWSKAAGYTSRRLDVPRDHLLESLVPKPGVQYVENYKERYVRMEDEVSAFVDSVLGR